MYLFIKMKLCFIDKESLCAIYKYIFKFNIQLYIHLNFCKVSSQRFKILTLADNNPIHFNGSLHHEFEKKLFIK